MDQLPTNEWVVIFYPQTGSVRLCPTLDYANHYLSAKSALTHVYKSPAVFRQRHDHDSLERFWRAVYKNAAFYLPKTATGTLEGHDPTPPDVDTETFANLFWQLLQDVGDRLVAPVIKTEKAKDQYELKLVAMRALAEDEGTYKKTYNKQARTVFSALLDYNQQFLTEDDIKKLIFELVAARKLKTKQKPWVIFQYYRPQFIKDGFIVRGKGPKIRG